MVYNKFNYGHDKSNERYKKTMKTFSMPPCSTPFYRPVSSLPALRRQFDLLDTDEDGHISPLHLTNVLRSIDLHITDKEMTDVMAKTDINGKTAD